MAETKRYILRLYMSVKHMTANVVDRKKGKVVATASTVEHAIKNAFDLGRNCNEQTAAVIGEVLAMRAKTEILGGEIYIDVDKEIENKGLEKRTKIWATIDAMKSRGVKIVVDDDDHRNGCG